MQLLAPNLFQDQHFPLFFSRRSWCSTLCSSTRPSQLHMFSCRDSSRRPSRTRRYIHTHNLNHNHNHQITITFPREELITKHWFKQLELLSFFLIELCLVEYEMLKYPPSFVAAAAIYTAQCTLHGVAQWSKTCEWHSSYSEDQLMWVLIV